MRSKRCAVQNQGITLKQRRDNFPPKNKLINLSLFILFRSRTIFRNLKENMSKIMRGMTCDEWQHIKYIPAVR